MDRFLDLCLILFVLATIGLAIYLLGVQSWPILLIVFLFVTLGLKGPTLR